MKFNNEKKEIYLQESSFNGNDLKNYVKKRFEIENFHLCTTRGIDVNLQNDILNGDVFCLYPKALGGKVS